MASRDVVAEVTNQLKFSFEPTVIVTGGTKLHNQRETQLCVSLTVTSALRHAMKNKIPPESVTIGKSTIKQI